MSIWVMPELPTHLGFYRSGDGSELDKAIALIAWLTTFTWMPHAALYAVCSCMALVARWLLRKKIILQKLIMRMRKIIGVSLGTRLCTKQSSLHLNYQYASYEHAIH